jgi:hypothetical protein
MTVARHGPWQRLRHTRLRDLIRGRIDGRLDWRRVVAVAELPDEAAIVIENVISRTNLWRIEKVEVADELVSHFGEGLSAGSSVEELTGNFGDPAQAARLIRRAKKRGRPLWWHGGRWICWSTVGLVAVYAAMLLQIVAGKPSVCTDYLALMNHRAAGLPEEETAWPVYRNCLVELSYDPTTDLRVGVNTESVPGDNDWPKLVEFLDKHAQTIAKLRQAADHPTLGFGLAFERSQEDEALLGGSYYDLGMNEGPHPSVIGVQLPHFLAARTIARILVADARRAAVDGDGATAMNDLVAVFGLSRQLQETPLLVPGLHIIGIRDSGFSAIQEFCSRNPGLWSESELQGLAHAVAASELDWHWWIEGERLSFHDTIQRLYTDDGNGDGRITDEGLSKLEKLDTSVVLLNSDSGIGTSKPQRSFAQRVVDGLWNSGGKAALTPLTIASRRELTETYDGLIDRSLSHFQTPLWEWTADDPETVIVGWTPMEKLRFLPIAVLWPALQAVRNRVERSSGRSDGVMIGLSLELYRRRHGKWPASLDELSPRYLPAVPVDRITGLSLGYRLIDDRPVVYSVGIDHDADGGRIPTEEDGRPNPGIASPGGGGSLWPATDPYHDGDWVIWSTTKQGAGRK